MKTKKEELQELITEYADKSFQLGCWDPMKIDGYKSKEGELKVLWGHIKEVIQEL